MVLSINNPFKKAVLAYENVKQVNINDKDNNPPKANND